MKTFIISALVVIIVIIGAVLIFDVGRNGTVAVASFNECAALGYPVAESFPRTCTAGDGTIFIEQATSTPVTPTPTATTTPTNPPKATSTPSTNPNLRNVSVKSGAKVTSPLTITGEAKLWYFEASFPVQLRDANNRIIAQGPAQALDDWMTTQFVPFKATLTFTKPTTATGTLILMNDNPSGDPALQEVVRIPVAF